MVAQINSVNNSIFQNRSFSFKENPNPSFCRKTFLDLNPSEKFQLKNLSRSDGIFRSMLENLNNKKIDNPENIIISFLTIKKQIVAWMVLDDGNEYNLYDLDVCSMMFYTHPDYRNQGLTHILIENNLDLIKDVYLAGYVPSGQKEHFFFKSIKEKYNLNLTVKQPTFYFVKE